MKRERHTFDLRILDACEIKIWAERRMGELLAEMSKHPPRPDRSHRGTDLPPPTLADLGTNKNQSSRCQKIASVGEDAIRECIARVRADDRADLSTAAILRLAKDVERDELRRENRELVESAKPADSVIALGETFQTITLDPPWDWGDEGDGSQFGRGDPTYATMPWRP